LGISARLLAILLLPLALAGCLGFDSEDTRTTSFMPSSNAVQPFPNNYDFETVSFLKTYLNNPVGIREALIAVPVERTVGGKVLYVACVRFSERRSDGAYGEARDRAIVFVNGRLDRILTNASEECAGAVYRPFPDLEKLQR
jgi:hypothetical protein